MNKIQPKSSKDEGFVWDSIDSGELHVFWQNSKSKLYEKNNYWSLKGKKYPRSLCVCETALEFHKGKFEAHEVVI